MLNQENSYVQMRLLVSFFCFLIVSTSIAQSTEQIVNNYLKALGGAEKWNSLNSKIEESLYIQLAPKNGLVFGLSASDTLITINKFKRPNKIFYSSLKKGDSFSNIMCYNDQVFWTQSNNGILSIQSKEDGQYFIQVNMMGFADVLLEKNTELEYLGKEKLGEEEFYTLRVKRQNWYLSSKYYFNKDTGLLFCATSEESRIKRYTVFKDYRRVNGVLFHFIEEGYDAQWNLETKSIIKKRLVNTPIDDSEFGIPHSN